MKSHIHMFSKRETKLEHGYELWNLVAKLLLHIHERITAVTLYLSELLHVASVQKSVCDELKASCYKNYSWYMWLNHSLING